MKKNKADLSRGERSSSVVSVGFIFFLLDKLSDAFFHALTTGLFGRIFTSYTKEQNAFQQGFLKGHFSSGTKLRAFFRKLRQYFSEAFESSFFVTLTERCFKALLALPLKSLGNFLFSFGIYTVLIYVVKILVPGLNGASAGEVIIGVCVAVISLPMLRGGETLASAIKKSVFAKALFVDAFGYREEEFESEVPVGRRRANFMIILGMLLGILTMFFHPLLILLGLAILILVGLIFSAPEIGVLLALTLCPFFSFFSSPAIALGLLVLLTLISYFIKLIRGKRILKLEIMDLSVMLFMVVLYFSGAITAGGSMGMNEVLLSCLLMTGYFLMSNLMRTELWLKRCTLALTTSGTVVAKVGVLQYVFGFVQNGAWLDTAYFDDIKGRVVSVFDNPNVLAFYLIMILPFSLWYFLKSKERKTKLLSGISFASVLLCIVLTWCRGAWIASAVCIVLVMLIYNRRAIRYFFLSVFVVPIMPMILPDAVTRRLTSIGDISDSSTMYRLYTWKGSLRAAWDYFMGGIGYGNSAYAEIYPQYAYAGIEAAEHSHNLFLQILLGVGISGLIVFFVVLLLFSQMSLEYMKNTKDVESKMMVAAACGAIGAALVAGLFDFIWYNYRVFFIFWCIIGFACACVRVGMDERRRHDFIGSGGENQATLELNL